MATEAHIALVEGILRYEFREKLLLAQALTAAGAEQENYDGNRKLAQLGTALIDFLSVYVGFEARVTRGERPAIT
jgi:dsRNA-specific ribonuclease